MILLRIKNKLKKNKSSIITCIIILSLGFGIGLYKRLFHPTPLGFTDITPPNHHPQYDVLMTSQANSKKDLTPSKNESIQKIVIHISGAVKNPGVYTLNSDQRLAELITIVQILDNADLDSVNLARNLKDGEKIIIPFRLPQPPNHRKDVYSSTNQSPHQTNIQHTSSLPDAASQHSKIININTATQDELVTIKGIGPVSARRIIQYRNTSGPFHSIEDLLNVKGIGTKTLNQLAPHISF